MAETEGMATASHVDDLIEYREGDVEDVPPFIRDLPAKYGIRSEDMRLPVTARQLKEQMDSANPKERAEAERVGQRSYYLILNLMRAESGLPFTVDNIQAWQYSDLFGKQRRGYTNMGNPRLKSLQVPQVGATDQSYARDAEPGTLFRLLAHKGNFFVILASLRFFDGSKLSPEKLKRLTLNKNHQTGKALLAFVDGADAEETTPVKQAKAGR